MVLRPFLALVLLCGAWPAAAQRTDILTGEPVRPPSAHPRSEPEIVNAPHAPPQALSPTAPMEIYIAPQVGIGSGTMGGPPSRRAAPRAY